MDGICSRYEKADKMTYPRLGAMCETVWRGENSYEQFHNKLDYYYSYLDKTESDIQSCILQIRTGFLVFTEDLV